MIKAIRIRVCEELKGGEPLVPMEPADVIAPLPEWQKQCAPSFTEFETRVTLFFDEACMEAVAKHHGLTFCIARKNNDD